MATSNRNQKFINNKTFHHSPFIKDSKDDYTPNNKMIIASSSDR